MKTLSLILASVLGLAAATSPVIAAQLGRRDDRRQADRVCVYQNSQFSGWEECFYPGDEIADLSSRRNAISSIRVVGDAQVLIYANKNFEAASLAITSDVRDLAQVSVNGNSPLRITWNDSIESLRVLSRRNSPGPGDYRRDDRRNDEGGICVYESADYRGRSECWQSGDDVRDLGRSGDWSDRISSIRIFGGERVTVYRDIHFVGERLIIDRDIPDLRQLRLRGTLNWDNQISSLEIRGGRGRGYGRGSRFR